MGRPEAPLDPSASPVAAFAHRLRELRRAANEPTYEAMARRSGKSRTVLSDAASGRRLPSWPTVEAYVTACGGEAAPWRAEWEALAAAGEQALLRTPLPPAAAPSEVEAEHAADVVEAPTTGSSPGSGRRPSRTLIALGVIGLLIIAALGVLVVRDHRSPAGESAAAAVTVTVRDGADPEDTGCARLPGVVLLDTTEVDFNGLPAGEAQLKYSPSCGAAWPRFQPSPKAEIPTHAVVHVDILRPDDHNVRFPFDAKYTGVPVFGNMALSTSQCVYAAVWIENGDESVPESHTHCFRGATYVR